MYCVIDLRPHLDEAELLLSSLSDEYKLTRGEMAELCYRHLNDQMNRRMYWADATTSATDMLIRAGMAEDDACCYMATVFEEYTNQVSELLHSRMGDKTWAMWYAIKKGEDITLLSGEDYRVVEWERLVQNGKIPRPANYPAPPPAKRPVRQHVDTRLQQLVMTRLCNGRWRYTMAQLRYSQPNKEKKTED